MSYIVKAGTPHLRYTDPQVTGAANPRGLYPWSAFYAPLTFIARKDGLSSLVAAYGGYIDQKQISLLLFTADLPVVAQAYVRGAETARFNVQPIQNLLTLPPEFVSTSPEGGDPVTVSNYGEVLKGYTAPFGPAGVSVAVSGFPARLYDLVNPPNTDMVSVVGVAGTVLPDGVESLAVLCIANSGSVAGVIGPLFCSADDTAISGAPTPIILLSNQYTQAIKDNGNLCVTENGDQGQVVGLYYVTPD